jgi:protein-S-isoprenylcysteine O-methyltransferase Ste14
MVHTMVLTEEEHLLDLHGEVYARYRARVPRYIGVWRRRLAAGDGGRED